jgi:hypothetical protein
MTTATTPSAWPQEMHCWCLPTQAARKFKFDFFHFPFAVRLHPLGDSYDL